MSELRKFVQEEAKKARIEALKSCTYEQICDLLDNQEKQMKDLERQLEEVREVIGCILNITYDSEGVAGYHNNGDVALWEEFEEIQQLEEQLKEKGDE